MSDPNPLAYLRYELATSVIVAYGSTPIEDPGEGFGAYTVTSPAEAAKLTEPGTKTLDVNSGVITVTPPPPPPLVYTGTLVFDVQLRTTDDQAHEIYRITMDQRVVHQATATIIGIDAGNFVSKAMEGRFVHKRLLGNAIQVGIAVLSDIHDTAAAAWQPNALPSGADVVFTVKGALGRTIDWTLTGQVFVYAPAGQ